MTLFVGAARWTGGSLGGLFRRRRPGDAWEQMALPAGVQVQAVTADPHRGGVIFAATDQGLFRTSDGGERWQRLNTGEPAQAWAVFVHPRDARLVYTGTSPLGVLRSEDGGDSWRAFPVALPPRVSMSFACRVMRFAADPVRTDRLFAALEVGGAMRSEDGGETWQDCGRDLVRLAQEFPSLRSRIQSDSDTEGMLDAHAIAISSAQPDSVLLAVRMGLFQSDDEGVHWNDLQVGRFSPLTYARDLRVSPHDPSVLFACLSPASRSTDGALYRSDNMGKTWTRADRGIKANATMMALALDRRDPRALHCISRCGQVFSSEDAGESWTESWLPDGVQDVYAIDCA